MSTKSLSLIDVFEDGRVSTNLGVVTSRSPSAPSRRRHSWDEATWKPVVCFGIMQAGNEVFEVNGIPHNRLQKFWSIREFSLIPGEWFAVLEKVGSAARVILTDQFGLTSLFYSAFAHREGIEIAVSASFRSLRNYMAFKGSNVSLFLPAVVAPLCSNTNIFRTRA